MAERIVKEKDLAVNRYLQRLLDEYVAGGGKLIELARRAGVARSVLTQIRSTGQGGGNRTAPRLAEALGLDFPELYRRAHDWWAQTGGVGPVPTEPLPPLVSARSHPRLRELPGWDAGVALARQNAPFVPERFFTAFGAFGVPPGAEVLEVDATLIEEVAMALYKLSIRREAQRETTEIGARVEAKRVKK